MGHFVAQDAFNLFRRQVIHQARRHGDRRMRRVSARREGVGHRVVDNIDLRHRQAGPAGQAPHDAVQGRRRFLTDLAGPVLGQDHLVAVPIGDKVHADRKNQHDKHALAAADIVPD